MLAGKRTAAAEIVAACYTDMIRIVEECEEREHNNLIGYDDCSGLGYQKALHCWHAIRKIRMRMQAELERVCGGQ